VDQFKKKHTAGENQPSSCMQPAFYFELRGVNCRSYGDFQFVVPNTVFPGRGYLARG
jgi:hypothetical protein